MGGYRHGAELQLEELCCEDEKEADGCLDIDVCSEGGVGRGDLFD